MVNTVPLRTLGENGEQRSAGPPIAGVNCTGPVQAGVSMSVLILQSNLKMVRGSDDPRMW
jgi:hypothetical protein